MRAPPKIGSHYRVPWRRTDPSAIFIHTSYNKLLGTQGRSERDAQYYEARYKRAKTGADFEAAVEIVNDLWNDSVIDKIVDRMLITNMPTIIAMPHPEFDAGAGETSAAGSLRNALPIAYARSLAEELGCEVDYDIIECARPGRTKLDTFQRFIWQPKFSGTVKTDHAYILADDVCTICGTFASLRSYIVEHGGTVIAASALAQGSGCHVQFPIAEGTVRVLRELYGQELFDYWKREIGHDIECLTEAEGQRLATWHKQNCQGIGTGPGSLQRLRDRIAQATENRG